MKFAFKPIAIAAALAFIGTAAVASPMKPGTYTAKVNGHNAPLTVEVTVDANKILSIKTPDDQESLGVGKVGLKKTADNILRYQSIGVDAVTGATFSSNALKEGLEKWHKKADGKCSCDYSFHMSVVEWNEEIEREIQDMINEGITSFKLYMTYPAMIVDDGDLYKIIKKLNEYGCFAGVHCENAGAIDALIAEAKKEGRLGPENHPLVRPDIMEAEAVHRLLVIADAANAPVMVVHLTNRKAFEEVMRARMNGQKVYAETCPQYLLLDDSVYSKPDFEGAKYVCAPPIRKKADQDCLWKALANDQIQTVATDQCSFTMEQKALGKDDFTKIPGGLPGVQTRGTLLYTYGVRTGRITQEQMCRLLSENAAKLYGVYPNKGVIREGSDADIVVFDPEKENVISAKTHLYHTDNNPYEGFKLHGDIDSVYLRGAHVVQDGKVILEKTGKYIKRGNKQ